MSEAPPPGGWVTHHDAVLQLAHAVVWHAGGSVRGGFVRDWVLRGEPANDLDVAPTRADQSTLAVERSLRAFLAQSPAAIEANVTIMPREHLPYARRLVVQVGGVPEPITVDIQKRTFTELRDQPADADVDNLRISRARGLHILVGVNGHTVQSAIEHARAKQFVFFDPFETGDDVRDANAVRRLHKLLKRGWTCLSRVPASVLSTLPESERALVHSLKS